MTDKKTINAKSTKTLPMGPEFVDAIWTGFVKTHGSGEVDPASLIGYALWQCREWGVRGWSEVSIDYEIGTLDATPEEIANRPEGKPE